MDAPEYKKSAGLPTLLFFLFFILLQIHHPLIWSQEANQRAKISIVAIDKPLKDILKELENKGGIHFAYNNRQVDDGARYTLIARKKPLAGILDELFILAGIEYHLIEKQLVLKPVKKALGNKIINTEPLKRYTFSGYLKDSETGEALIGALVMVQGTQNGTLTNSYGFFSLTLPAGIYDFEFSFAGYQTILQTIQMTTNLALDQKMNYKENKLEVVVISANQSKDIKLVNPLKKISFTPSTISSKIGINAETELIQVLQSVPGIHIQSDGSVHFYTRGGNRDQNLVMVDDAPVYHPSHLFGFFSVIAPDAINEISVYKNSFPVQFGGKLSSVVDIRTKEGNLNSFGIHGNSNPLTTGLSIEGPIIREKSSYFISLRKTHLNWINTIAGNEQDFGFIDLHAKFNTKINKKNRIFFSFYTGNDEINSFKPGNNTYSMKWQNVASTLRWNYLFSEKLFSNTMIYASLYDYYLYTSKEQDQYWNSRVGNLSIKSDFSFYARSNHTFRFGAAIHNHFFNPGNLNDLNFSQKVTANDALEGVGYFGHEIHVGKAASINYGIRLVNWNSVGPAVSHLYNVYFQVIDTLYHQRGVFHSFTNLEPKLELIVLFNSANSLKLSYNRQVQNIHHLSNSISPFTTLDIWMPSSFTIKPQKSRQFSVGYFRKFVEFDLAIESYLKQMTNQIDYAENANMLLNPFIESQLRFGNIKSAGFEISINKTKGSLTGSISYAYSKSISKFKGLNGNRPFYPFYHKPHASTINLSYKTGHRLRLNLNWVYSSGSLYSSPSGFYYLNNSMVPYYTSKNNARLPDYHRLDFSANYRLNKTESKKYLHYLTLSFYNIYGRKNPINISYNKIETEGGSFVVPADYITENQIRPTSIYLFGMFPMLSYRFTFQNKR
jgi:hypothetical protein